MFTLIQIGVIKSANSPNHIITKSEQLIYDFPMKFEDDNF